MKRWMVLGAVALVAMVGVVAVARTQGEDASATAALDDAMFMTADTGHESMDAMGAGPGRRGGRGRMRGGDGWDMGGRGGRGGMMGMGRHHGGPRLEALASLGLSDAQRTKLADLREQRMKATIPIRADLELAQLELQKLMRADRPDLDLETLEVSPDDCVVGDLDLAPGIG